MLRQLAPLEILLAAASPLAGQVGLAPPAGAHTYTVTATYEGKPRTRKVTVGNRLSTAYLRWPSDPAKDFVPRATAGAKK